MTGNVPSNSLSIPRSCWAVMLRTFTLMLLVFGAAQIHAATYESFVADYAPFRNGDPWPQVPLIAYTEGTSNVWVHPSAPTRFATVREVHDADADFTTVVIRFPNDRVLKTHNAMVLGPYLAAVYTGDLNKDNIPDFIAIKPGSGCGLAAEYGTAVFAFSQGPDYRFTRVTAMGLGPHALVLDPKTSSFRFIHTSFRQAQSLDGRVHSFWVHRFYRWEDGRFAQDANLEPVWIQYLNRPNHELTKLLNSRLRAEAWQKDPESQAGIEW